MSEMPLHESPEEPEDGQDDLGDDDVNDDLEEHSDDILDPEGHLIPPDIDEPDYQGPVEA